jgi:hypothetical protein
MVRVENQESLRFLVFHFLVLYSILFYICKLNDLIGTINLNFCFFCS